MYKLFDLIRAVREALQPYSVDVYWDGLFYRHHAWTRADARAWFACYPCDARCETWTRGWYRGPVIVEERRADDVVGRCMVARMARRVARVTLWDEV